MILLDEVFELFEWLASQNSYIQHTLNGTGSANRFSRYKTESLAGQNSNLGSPRLEVCELPYGALTDGLGWERDKAIFTIRVIYRTDKFNTAPTVTAHDNAKKALLELFNYLFTAQVECTDCNDLLCLFNLSTVKYSWIDKATLGGDYVGCMATVELRKAINWDSITYGERPPYTTQQFNTWLHGNGAPDNALGIDGDFYLADDSALMPYYRKVNGAWQFQRNIAADTSSFYTKTQVDNLLLPIAGDITALDSSLGAHIADTANPHQVTLEQARTADNYFNGAVDMNGNALQNLPDATTDSEPATFGQLKQYIDTTIKALEGYNPTSGLYPVTYGGNAIKKGDSFKITATGTVNGIAVKVGDFLIALIDAPGQTDANWQIGQSNVDQATETAQGIAMLATQAEVQNELTNENTKIVTPQRLWLALVRFVAVSWTWTARQIFSVAPRLSTLTASTPVAIDSNKDVTSLTAAIWGSFINSLTGKTTPADTDAITLADSADTNTSKKLTWANVKATLKTYFDTLYTPANAWVDYSASSTIVGFSSFTTKIIRYQTAHKRLHIAFNIQGTSNSTTTTFTIPAALSASAGNIVKPIYVVDNTSVIAVGRVVVLSGQSTATFHRDIGGTAFTASGGKSIVGEFTIEID
jgi:hypothetical protein